MSQMRGLTAWSRKLPLSMGTVALAAHFLGVTRLPQMPMDVFLEFTSPAEPTGW
jgi:hypothetical protein